MDARVALVAVLLTSSCGGGQATAPPPETLIGTWNASSVELVAKADATVHVDLVGDLGASVTLALQESGDFTMTVSYAGAEPGGSWPWGASSEVTGTWSVTDVLTLQTSPTSEWQFDAVLEGDSLTLTGADTSFDFDANGTVEDADLSLALTRS